MSFLMLPDDDGAPVTVDTIQKWPNVLQEELKKAEAEITAADENYNSFARAFSSLKSKFADLQQDFDVRLVELAESQKQNHLHDLKSIQSYRKLVSSTDQMSTNMSNLLNSLQKLIESLELIKNTTSTIYSDLLKTDEELDNLKVQISHTFASTLTSVEDRLYGIFTSLDKSMERLKPFQAAIPGLQREIKAYKDALASSPVIHVINQDRFPILKRFLAGDIKEIVKMTQSDYDVVDEVLDYVELNQLRYIFCSDPNSNITLIGCKYNIKFAHWTAKKDHVQMSLIKDDLWSERMGPVKHQGDHDCCWAIVSAELVSTVRHVLRRDTTYVEYSAQYLVDFTRPELRCLSRKTAHFCYPLHVKDALEFISKKGIEREDARPFRSHICEEEVSPAEPSNLLEYIKEAITLDNVEEAVEVLHKYPIACDVPIFEPDYGKIGDKIYRGPSSRISRYVTQHSGNLVGGGVENGEKYLRFRSSLGEAFGFKGTMKISVEVMLMCLSSRIERLECGVDCDITMEDPFPLMTNFVYPSLLSTEEEEEKRKEDQRSSSGRPE